MGHHDELIDRLTHRLRVDPDLRADVEAELRTHLEDSEADFRAAGDDEATAAANAARALGDERDLAEQLWQANRRRIRLRRVCKWAARVALIPGAILTVLLVASGPWDTLLMSPISVVNFGGEESLHLVDAFISEGIGEELSADEFLILQGDPAVSSWADRMKGSVERWPENDVYQANYVFRLLYETADSLPRFEAPVEEEAPSLYGGMGTGSGAPVIPATEPLDPTAAKQALADMLAALDAAERACPDNALYNYAKAGLLIRASADDIYYSRGWDPTKPDERPTRPYVYVDDQAMFDRALAELAKGQSKPVALSRLPEMVAEQVAILERSDRFADKLWLTSLLSSTAFNVGYTGPLRSLARTTLASALESAEDGHADRAWRLNRQVEIMATKMGEGTPTIIDLLNAEAIHRLARGNRADIHRALGQEDLAAALEAEYDRLQEEFRARLGANREIQEARKRHAPLAFAIIWSNTMEYDSEPVRTAEHLIAEQTGLALLLTCVALAATIAGVTYGLSVIFKRAEGARLLFVGWGQLGRICLFAVVIPLGLAAIYTHWLPISNRQYGLWFIAERVAVEFAAAMAIILGLLWGLTYSAIRMRAKEAGLTTPPPLRWRNRPILSTMATLLGACAIFFIATDGGPEIENNLYWVGTNFEYSYLGFLLAGVIALFMLAWAIRELVFVFRLRGDYLAFKRTLVRSSVGVLAAAVIVIGLFCGVALHHAEATAVRRISGTALPGMHNETELSTHRFIRDDLRARHAELMAEGAANSEDAGAEAGL